MRILSRYRPAALVGACLVIAAAHLAAAPPATRTAIKGESSLSYQLTHPLHEVTGVSKDVRCTIEYDDATKVVRQTAFSADVMSFDSGNSNRDSHAMEVLDALTYPTVSFESTHIESAGSTLHVQGNLTFHGRTKPIAFDATTAATGDRFTVNGTAAVSLTAFEIERPSLLMIPVKDTLHISFTMAFPPL